MHFKPGWYVFVGNFQPGDNVLIHAGGSGVGTAATQLVLAGKGRVTLCIHVGD